jgi:hypothetical protein
MFAFVKQAEELGLRPKEMHSRFLGAAFGQAVGERLAEGVVGGSYSAQKWFAGKRVEKALVRCQAGDITFQERSIHRQPPHCRVRLGLALVPECLGAEKSLTSVAPLSRHRGE